MYAAVVFGSGVVIGRCVLRLHLEAGLEEAAMMNLTLQHLTELGTQLGLLGISQWTVDTVLLAGYTATLALLSFVSESVRRRLHSVSA